MRGTANLVVADLRDYVGALTPWSNCRRRSPAPGEDSRRGARQRERSRLIGGVLVFGGSERTTVEGGFGGATGANDVASARIAQRTNFRTMFIALPCLLLVSCCGVLSAMGALSVALLSSTTLGVEAPMQNQCKLYAATVNESMQ